MRYETVTPRGLARRSRPARPVCVPPYAKPVRTVRTNQRCGSTSRTGRWLDSIRSRGRATARRGTDRPDPRHDRIDPSPTSPPALRLGEPGWLQHAVAWYVRFAPVSLEGMRGDDIAILAARRDTYARAQARHPGSDRQPSPSTRRITPKLNDSHPEISCDNWRRPDVWLLAMMERSLCRLLIAVALCHSIEIGVDPRAHGFVRKLHREGFSPRRCPRRLP